MSSTWPFSFLGDNITLFSRYLTDSSSPFVENMLECPLPDPLLIQFGFLAFGTVAFMYQLTSVLKECIPGDRFRFFEDRRPSYVAHRLRNAGLNDPSIQAEIKRRGEHGHNYAWVLLQLHREAKLTDSVKHALSGYSLKTLAQCVIAVINFSANVHFTRAKRRQLEARLQDDNFSRLMNILLKNQLLSLSVINQMMRVHPSDYSYYCIIFDALNSARELSEDIYNQIMLLSSVGISYLVETVTVLENSGLVTSNRVSQLLSIPWLLTEDAYRAIWSRIGDLTAGEFEEIILRTQMAVNAGHEPAEADFRDNESRRMSPDFVFFEPKITLPSMGINAELLSDYEGDVDCELICPLSQNIMTYPVRIQGQPTQHVFEQSWIEDYLETSVRRKKNRTNPMTNLVLPDPVVYEPAEDIAEKIAAKMEEVSILRRTGPSL